MMNNQNIIEEQHLIDYFSGLLSDKERIEVEAWIQSSTENQKIASDIRYLLMATDVISTINAVDSATALKQVHGRIKMLDRKRKPFWVWIQRVAAIMMLPLLISTLYFIFAEEPIEYIEMQTNPGMIASTNLPDGSTVWLNSSSRLKYPKKFIGDTRMVEIDGEAYFSVKKDAQKKFLVTTPFNFKVEVLGTEFNIEAYKNYNYVTTTLVNGSVNLAYSNNKNLEESLIMKPRDEVIYDTKLMSILQNTPYVPTSTAWKDGLVVLRNTPLEKVLRILGKRFNAEFIVKNPTLYDYSFTGIFAEQHLSLILEHFHLSSKIKFKFIADENASDVIPKRTVVELY